MDNLGKMARWKSVLTYYCILLGLKIRITEEANTFTGKKYVYETWWYKHKTKAP